MAKKLAAPKKAATVHQFTPDLAWLASAFPAPDAAPYIDAEIYGPYQAAGLIVANSAVVAPNGAHQCVLTAQAIALLSGSAAVVEPLTVKATPVMAFEIDTDVPKPEAARRGRGESRYPFERMEVGTSFHIPATAEKANPARDYASSISSATKRLEPKRFSIRPVGDTDPRGVGARVFRDADYTAVELQELVKKRAKRAAEKAVKSVPHALSAQAAE